MSKLCCTFCGSKGDSDIHVVFDGTSCGLNESLWSPNFFLPTSKNAAELLSFDSWMADVDFGEFFHNFFADEIVRKHAGEVSSLVPFFPVSNSEEHRISSLWVCVGVGCLWEATPVPTM
jgi:hypothetical protein